MKRIKIIITALLLGLVFGTVNAQEQDKLPYKSLASFNNDTLQYLEYNFLTRHDQYKGKKVSDVINDIKLPILYFGRISKGNSTIALMLVVRQLKDEPSELFDYYVTICFGNPPSSKDFTKIVNQPRRVMYPKWTPQIYEFIKDLEVSDTGPNYFIIREKQEKEKKEKADKQ
jgi:hypothetical protein